MRQEKKEKRKEMGMKKVTWDGVEEPANDHWCDEAKRLRRRRRCPGNDAGDGASALASMARLRRHVTPETQPIITSKEAMCLKIALFLKKFWTW